ncbi:MAG: hypothetical protein WBL06_07200 [Pseudolysinimonas sp.]|uniref:hypothetical protein n=1 Tax=Pseudolysinimonas sp. TaxID=2680009 RepID=UPI003C76A03E
MTSDDVTPADLAKELGIDAKRIRAFLRATYGKLNRSVETRWKLTPDQASKVRRHFARAS